MSKYVYIMLKFSDRGLIITISGISHYFHRKANGFHPILEPREEENLVLDLKACWFASMCTWEIQNLLASDYHFHEIEYKFYTGSREAIAKNQLIKHFHIRK